MQRFLKKFRWWKSEGLSKISKGQAGRLSLRRLKKGLTSDRRCFLNIEKIKVLKQTAPVATAAGRGLILAFLKKGKAKGDGHSLLLERVNARNCKEESAIGVFSEKKMVEVVVAVIDKAVFRGAPAFTAEEMQLARRDQYGISGFAVLEGISVGVRR